MAPNRSSFSILLVLVLMFFSQALAREFMVKKQADVKYFNVDKPQGDDYAYNVSPPASYPVTAYSVPPPPCCDGEEKKAANADQFKGEGQGGH